MKIPEGWRQLGVYDFISPGDKYYIKSEGSWNETRITAKTLMGANNWTAYITKMEKFEFKSGMVIENGIGERGLIVFINDSLKVLWYKKQTGKPYFLGDHPDSWLHSFGVKIWQGVSFNCSCTENLYAYKLGLLLNEVKPKVKEVTLEEVAAKFGVPVEQIRIKE